MACPIDLAGISGKELEVIAAAVVAQLLMAMGARHEHDGGRRATRQGGSALPRIPVAPTSAHAASVQTITAPDGRSNTADSASPSA
jgi:hypothetical protein